MQEPGPLATRGAVLGLAIANRPRLARDSEIARPLWWREGPGSCIAPVYGQTTIRWKSRLHQLLFIARSTSIALGFAGEVVGLGIAAPAPSCRVVAACNIGATADIDRKVMVTAPPPSAAVIVVSLARASAALPAPVGLLTTAQ